MNTDRHATVAPFARPLYVMLKPAGARCNLACRYCYYLDKNSLYSEEANHNMSDELLELFIKQYLGAQTQREVLFIWHGGETMLRPLSFYQKALQLQQKYAGNHLIDNCIQTNGTLLTEEWCRFLHDNNWLVGLSIDGTAQMHDAFRRDRNGQPTHHRVMRAAEMLTKHDVMWNAMAVVNRLNAEDPLAFYRFFKSIGCHYIQFTPIVEPAIASTSSDDTPDETSQLVTPESVLPGQWGRFLCTLFDEWVRKDVGEYFVQIFDATLANWVGEEPGVCSMARSCGNALAMEFNGDVYSCDHFVFPEYRLGNMRDIPLAGLAFSEKQNRFRAMKTDLPAKCRKCEFEFACHGECPKNRLIKMDDGSLNFLCDGYKMFFRHARPYMDFMASEWLKEDGSPSRIMDAIRQGRI